MGVADYFVTSSSFNFCSHTCSPLPEGHLPGPLPIVSSLPVHDPPPAEVIALSASAQLREDSSARSPPHGAGVVLGGHAVDAGPDGGLGRSVADAVGVDGETLLHLEPGAATAS